jgi:4'-phosphopantetheinyl transferase EntD
VIPPASTYAHLVAALLPDGVSVSATGGEEIEAPLFAAEELALRCAVPSRRREFVTGRACAREALEGLGLPRRAVPVGAAGAPQWPPGVVGSITHCPGFRAAAVGLASDFAAIAIDAEPDRRLPAGTLGAIALPVELELVRRHLREGPGPSWDRLLFSVKESVYKAWYPLTGIRLSFADAVVTFGSEPGGFSVRLRAPQRCPLGDGILTGRWSARAGLLATAIALPAIED